MGTRTLGMIQDENLTTRFGATSIAKDIKLSKAKKATTGLGGRKPLSDIALSGRVNSLKIKEDNVGGKSTASGVQKKAGPGGRKALSDLSNSQKFHQESKKNYSKTLNTIGEEQWLHNHHECIKSQKNGMDKKSLMRTLGFDDDLSMQLLSTPGLVPASVPHKVNSSAPLWHLEYEEVPELLNEDWIPSRCQTPKHPIASPFQDRYVSSPSLMLLESP